MNFDLRVIRPTDLITYDELGSKAVKIEGSTKFVLARVLTTPIPPDAFFNTGRGWYDECRSEHVGCGGHFPDTVLPDRIIDVALHGGDPRLAVGRGMTSQYATLSYCRGGSAPLMTLMSNLDQRMGGIPFKGLPKTFQDAITLCRALMIPYL